MCLIDIMQDRLNYYLALSKINGLGPITAKNLIRHFGSVENIFDASESDLKGIKALSSNQSQALLSDKCLIEAEKEKEIARKKGIRIISIESELYPYRLKQIEDAPLVLYSKGPADFNALRTVSIVGTRTASVMGMEYTRQIVDDLKKYNVTIISGMASGIDGCAHQTALKKKLPTIGVVAHGFKFRYPADNFRLFDEMEKDGAILTEFPYNVYASRDNFPRRNRIVAAMSDAVIVVESKSRGGSLITANLANDYNKDVFAVPGRLNDSNFSGCNGLIKSHKALLYQSADDIAYILRWEIKEGKKQIQLFENLNPIEKKIVNYLRVNDASSFEDIAFHCAIESSSLATALLTMEFNHLLKAYPGSKYQLVK